MLKAVAFYPEYFPDEMEENIKKIIDGGISTIRFGEFAWGVLEPEEGRFDFSIFDKAFALTEKAGISIILCTPTACPPAWLAQNHPEILPVNGRGQAIRFGARQHRCYNSPAMRGYTEKIVSRLADRYGKAVNLIGWQIDNELAAEHKYCFCPACTEKFHAYLRDRYRTVENLNREWFSTFWAQNYSSFEQIPLPYKIDAYLPMRLHPSLLYEFLRFSSESVVDFASAQADIIRKYSDKPVTTNQDDFYYGDNIDWYELFGKLDIAAFDIYTQRLYEIAFYCDLARSLKGGSFWQLEFPCDSPVLAAVMDNSREAGCGLFGLFKFNPFPAGQEEGTSAMLDIFGNPGRNYPVFRDWTGNGTDRRLKGHASLLYDFTSSWMINSMNCHSWEEGLPHIFSRLVYKDCLIHTVYKCLFDMDYRVGFVTDENAGRIDSDETAVLIVPMHIAYSYGLSGRLLEFMENGGHILATTDLFMKNLYNAYNREIPDFYRRIGLGNYAAHGQVIKFKKGGIRFLDPKTDYQGWKDAILDVDL